jgi:hypothetical protein
MNRKRTKAFIHKDRQKVGVEHRSPQGWADNCTDIAEVIGRKEAEQPISAYTSSHGSRACCASSCHDHSCRAFAGRNQIIKQCCYPAERGRTCISGSIGKPANARLLRHEVNDVCHGQRFT